MLKSLIEYKQYRYCAVNHYLLISRRLIHKLKQRLRLLLLVLSSLCMACTSSGPVTKYYSFFSLKEVNTDATGLADKSLSFGVGPIVIPEYMDNPGIVSISKQQQVRVSSQNAWAGDLKAAMGRVLADNLSKYWLLDRVSAFPWDNRVRPKYQLRLMFDEFGGERGGEVRLRVTWTMLNQLGNQIYLTESAAFSASATDETTENYVAVMNDLINQLSYALAVSVSNYLQQNPSIPVE